MKKLLVVLFSVLTMSSAWAVDKNISLYVAHKAGGLGSSLPTLVAEGLEKRGWKVDLKIIGNCGQTKHLIQNSKDPILVSWGADWNNDWNTCNLPPTKENFVEILVDAPRFVCGPPGDNNFKFETGRSYRIGTNAGQHHDILLAELSKKIGVEFKVIEYVNTGAIRKAIQGKEIDAWYTNGGFVDHKAGTQRCFYGTMPRSESGIAALKDVVTSERAFASYMGYLFVNDGFKPDQRSLLIKDVKEIVSSDSYQEVIRAGGNFTVPGTVAQQIDAVARNARSFQKP
jgi:tripartite-type tricarboxylate transporter receptor subunit TctC